MLQIKHHCHKPFELQGFPYYTQDFESKNNKFIISVLFSGSLIHLLKYETLRQRHNLPTMLVIDGLQKLYGTTITPFVLLRSLGLQCTDALSPVKVENIYILFKQTAAIQNHGWLTR